MVNNLIAILNEKYEYIWTRNNIMNQLIISLFNSKHNLSKTTL
jgi:hypothetical protein